MSNNPKSHVTVNFFRPEDVGPRDWGSEILIGHIQGVCTGKILKMNAGASGGLQYHHIKNECAHLVEGEMWFYYDEGDGVLKRRKLVAGDSVQIPPGAVHREEAITNCTIFEISNPVFNDRVRVESQYGEQIPEGGLPTTTMEEVIVK